MKVDECQLMMKQLQQSYAKYNQSQSQTNDFKSKVKEKDFLLFSLFDKVNKFEKHLSVECDIAPPEIKARGYLLESKPYRIILCANHLSSPADVEQLLRHELTHLYDHLSNRCSLSTCQGLAYSEVRAARNGECFSFLSSPMRRMISEKLFPFFYESCVKSHSVASTRNLFPQDGEKCVKEVFNKAIKDLG
jgi:hypothetical protein